MDAMKAKSTEPGEASVGDQDLERRTPGARTPAASERSPYRRPTVRFYGQLEPSLQLGTPPDPPFMPPRPR